MMETGKANRQPLMNNTIPRTTWIVHAVFKNAGSVPRGSRIIAGFRPRSENMANPTKNTVHKAMRPKASGKRILVKMRLDANCRPRWATKPPPIHTPDRAALPDSDWSSDLSVTDRFKYSNKSIIRLNRKLEFKILNLIGYFWHERAINVDKVFVEENWWCGILIEKCLR